ncbi:hypothetical protein [Micromonospora arborensis]|uniref:hypothetical protein n=1 Tax=Micromonospora arborensis TaxID=2116518 RepID=UPI00372348EE
MIALIVASVIALIAGIATGAMLPISSALLKTIQSSARMDEISTATKAAISTFSVPFVALGW